MKKLWIVCISVLVVVMIFEIVFFTYHHFKIKEYISSFTKTTEGTSEVNLLTRYGGDPWIMLPCGEVEGKLKLYVNGQAIPQSGCEYLYHNGDKIILSVEDIEKGIIVDNIDATEFLEEWASINWYQPEGEEQMSLMIMTPSDTSFVYDTKIIEINTFSLTV